jgi:uncharacterized membrane protein YfcA
VVSPFAIALALVITAIAALLQGTVGIGFAMVSVPLLALIDPRLAPVPQLLVALPLSLAIAWRERGSIELHGFWWIIVGRVPGAFIGLGLLAIATGRALDLFIGVVVVASTLVVARGVHVRRTSSAKFVAGVVSGTTGLVASIGGPPVALLYSSAEARTIRSTLASVFAIGLVLSLTFRSVSGNVVPSDLWVGAILLPAAALGYLLSSTMKDKMNASVARAGVLVISTLGGIALIFRALVG